MINIRYHIVSLTAVFVNLRFDCRDGVGLGGRG